MSDQTILITGAAGFIGFHVARQLLSEGREIVGLDNLNKYYDPALKRSRLDVLRENVRFSFVKADLADRPTTRELFAKHRFPVVIHLAAQEGVRTSIDHPHVYADANLESFVKRAGGMPAERLTPSCYAFSSSVYGANTKLPFSVEEKTDCPVSLYAATKKVQRGNGIFL